MAKNKGINLTKTKYDYILHLLEKYPQNRDSDETLISNMWYNELKQQGTDSREITGFQLLEMLAANKLTPPETIRRIRQKIQEKADTGQLPRELSGTKRKVKKNKQPRFRQQIRQL